MSIKSFRSLKEIVTQLKACGFQCEAGPLEMNEAFIALEAQASKEDTAPHD